MSDATTTSRHPDDRTDPPALDDALEVLLRFGSALLRAGDTAYRVRESMGALARSMGLEALSAGLTLNSITATVRRGAKQATMMREVGPPAVNSSRIVSLQGIALTASPGLTPSQLAAQLAAVEAAPARYPDAMIAAAVGAACGAFAFLSGGGPLEWLGAAIGGGVGQWLRASLARRGFNQHGVTALCAITASATCALVGYLSSRFGFGSAGHPAGFISSILFLVPGFPLVAALLDLLQHQTLIAVTRLAYGGMIFLAAAFGLSIVVGLVGFDVAAPPVLETSALLKLLLRGVASFVGGCAFAMLFNSSPRAVLTVGGLALAANALRLTLHDAGMMLAPATFLGALAVGILASLVHRGLGVPRIALTVPGIIVMVPGIPAFQMIVLFNQGQMLEALQAASLCGFVTGALGLGLAVARSPAQLWRGVGRRVPAPGRPAE